MRTQGESLAGGPVHVQAGAGQSDDRRTRGTRSSRGVSVGRGELIQRLGHLGSDRLPPMLPRIGDGAGDVDDWDEVHHEVEPVEDFAVGPDLVPGPSRGQGLHILPGLEVVKIPFSIREVAGDGRRSAWCPRVAAADGVGSRVSTVSCDQCRLSVASRDGLSHRAASPALSRYG